MGNTKKIFKGLGENPFQKSAADFSDFPYNYIVKGGFFYNRVNYQKSAAEIFHDTSSPINLCCFYFKFEIFNVALNKISNLKC